MKPVQHQMYINGQFVENSSDRWIDVINPATEALLSRIPEGTPEDAQRDIDAAVDAFFTSESQAVAVLDRYPQHAFAEHTHEFCELALVWRGNGLHILNDRPYRITRGDLFYISAEDKHSYASVNSLVLQNIIYCP